MAITYNFSDKVVLVTGGSGALGTATVETFRDANATVCMSARSVPKEGRGARILRDDQVNYYPADFTEENEVEEVFEDIQREHGYIDVLCSFIGAWRGGTPIDQTEINSFEFVMDVNLKTMFLAAKHAIPSLRKTNGSIVSVSAQSSLQGGNGDGPYRVSKAGVRLLTETIAKENRGDLRANAIMPSIIDTPDNREMLPQADYSRWPTPGEIADVVAFLCSDEATVTNGATVPVYGEADEVF